MSPDEAVLAGRPTLRTPAPALPHRLDGSGWRKHKADRLDLHLAVPE